MLKIFNTLPEQLHISSQKEFIRADIKPIKNTGCKPRGGFWTSTLNHPASFSEYLVEMGITRRSLDGFIFTPKKKSKCISY